MPVVTQGEMKRLDEYMAGQLASDVNITGGQITGVDVAGMIDVTAYGAKGDGITDCRAAFQLALDENPNGTIFIPRAGAAYVCSGEVVLTNNSGRNFQGSIVSNGATIRFSTNGNSTDSDANMQRGFASYATNLGSGGDVSGLNAENGGAIISGLVTTGPTNGCAFYIANGIGFLLQNLVMNSNRYGIACESTVNARFKNISGHDSYNALIGFIASNSPKVRYGATGYPNGMYNDAYTIDGLSYACDLVGACAAIIDYGSFSERCRSIRNFSVQGNNSATSVAYGYLGRGVLPVFENIWGENIRTLVRIISSNANEGGSGTTLAGISSHQPNGTLAVGAMPDTYSFGCAIFSAYTHNADIAFQLDCNGKIVMGAVLTDATRTKDVLLTQGGKTFINMGIVTTTGSAPVIDNSYGGYLDATKLAGMGVEPAAPTIVSGFGTGAYVVSNGSSSAFLINVGTGGTASSGVIQFSKAAPNGWVVLVNNITTRSTTVFQTLSNPNSTSQCTLKNFNSSMVQTPWAAGDNLQCVAFNY